MPPGKLLTVRTFRETPVTPESLLASSLASPYARRRKRPAGTAEIRFFLHAPIKLAHVKIEFGKVLAKVDFVGFLFVRIGDYDLLKTKY